DSTLNVTYLPTSDIQYSGVTSQVSGFTSFGYLPTLNLINSTNPIDTLCNIVNAIDDFKFLNTVKIFPNPLTSNLTIEIKCRNINSISIINLLGEKKLAVQLPTANCSLQT